MRRCPKCREWSLSFDSYFERFRCLNLDCCWMAPSATEREIRLLREHKEPNKIDEIPLPELGTVVKIFYDDINDALTFDFGLNEPSFELPENDGRMIWMIGRGSGSVTGFVLISAMKFEIEELTIKIVAKKVSIEQTLKSLPGVLSLGRPTRVLIEKVEVESKERMIKEEEKFKEYDYIFSDALKKVKQMNGHRV